jgi:hypothetical protein
MSSSRLFTMRSFPRAPTPRSHAGSIFISARGQT